MTFFEEHTEADRARTRGSLERITFSNDDSGEKSLLELIEERSANAAQDGDTESHEHRRINDIDDIDEEDRPELDHIMIRLGGNGF